MKTLARAAPVVASAGVVGQSEAGAAIRRELAALEALVRAFEDNRLPEALS